MASRTSARKLVTPRAVDLSDIEKIENLANRAQALADLANRLHPNHNEQRRIAPVFMAAVAEAIQPETPSAKSSKKSDTKKETKTNDES